MDANKERRDEKRIDCAPMLAHGSAARDASPRASVGSPYGLSPRDRYTRESFVEPDGIPRPMRDSTT